MKDEIEKIMLLFEKDREKFVQEIIKTEFLNKKDGQLQIKEAIRIRLLGMDEYADVIAKKIFDDLFRSSNNEDEIRRCIKEGYVLSFDRELQKIKKKWSGD